MAKTNLKIVDINELRKKKNKSVKSHAKDATKLANVFGKDAKKIQKLLKSKDEEGAILKTQRALLNLLIDMIPIAEKKYREFGNDRSAYALNALISQIRELMQDITVSQDRSRTADTIVFQVVKPAVLNFAQFIIDNSYQMKKRLSDSVDVKQVPVIESILRESTSNVGNYMQDFMEELETRIRNELSE